MHRSASEISRNHFRRQYGRPVLDGDGVLLRVFVRHRPFAEGRSVEEAGAADRLEESETD